MQRQDPTAAGGRHQSYVVGLDLGTSSVKAAAYDLGGRLVGRVAGACRTQSPQPGWQEQDPDQVLGVVLRVLRQLVVTHGQPAAVALSSAMHGLIAVDGKGRAISPCLLWSDQRSFAQAAELEAVGAGRAIHQATGTPVHPMSPLMKIAWMRRHQPGVFSQAARFEGIKEYVVRRLTGEAVMDESLASATGLYDAVGRCWHGPALDFAGISAARLPQVVSPFHQLGGLGRQAVRRCGLGPGTQVVMGGADGCLSNLGSGATRAGRAVLTIGTSAALRVVLSGPVAPSLRGLFRYVLYEGKWVVGGGSNSGAGVYEWFARAFLGMPPTSPRMWPHWQAMEGVPPGSEGLICLPHLLGERAPLWNPKARGCFHGIVPAHGLPHFHRAVLEGILLNQLLTGRRIAAAVGGFGALIADGGFTALDSWVQMAADVFGCPVYTLDSGDGAARGAALLALKSIGAIDDPESEALCPPVRRVFPPEMQRHEAYLRQVDRFEELYACLESTFEGN